MTITSISRDTNNNVSIVRMISNNTILEVQAANYILNNQSAINALNGGTWQWFISDMIVCWCSDGVALYTFTDSSFSTLIQYGESGGDIFLRKALNLSDVASRISSTQNLGLPTGKSSLTMLGATVASNPPDFIYLLNPSIADEDFNLPIANAANSMQLGNFFIVANASPIYKVTIKTNSGATSYIDAYPSELYSCTLIDNSTSDGTWLISPYINYINNLNSSSFGIQNCITTISAKNSCICATTANLSATYDNATSGRLSSLTSTVNGAISIDGYSPVVGDRVLVKDQTSAFQNGIYVVDIVGDLTHPYVLGRSYDYQPPSDTGNQLNIIYPGDVVTVAKGTLNAGTKWMQTQFVTNVGVDSISFINLVNNNPQKIVSLSADYTIQPSDNNTLFLVDGSLSGTLTITVPGGSTLVKGFTFGVHQNTNDNSIQVLIVSSSSNTFDYYAYGVVGLNGTVFYTLENNANNANFVSVADSGFYQDYYRIYNNVIDTYTLTQGDIGGFLTFGNTSTDKTLTLPANASLALNKGFWFVVYNPGPGFLTLSTTDAVNGPTIIYPGQVAFVVKAVFGGPNQWDVSIKKGIYPYSLERYTNSGGAYTSDKTDINNNIIVNTNNATVVLPNITTFPIGSTLRVHNKTSSIAFVEPAFGGNSIDNVVNTFLQPFEELHLISDGTSVFNTLSRSSNFIQRASTTDATLTDLTNNSNYFVLGTGYIINFRASISGSDVTNGKFASFIIEGCITSTTVGTVAFVGTPIVTVLGRTNAAYTAQAIADNVNKRLTFQVQGAVGDSLGWRAKIECMIAQNG